ncbi:Ldh family oxidoreductase [Catenuloplanes japonicus]|uniref:Ldh family oxidoreductase n=1 Tax=Catenuloplanes japonicus TaxID=33876 RepID=UPI00068AA293|nr:Ldh family oxidoreductase [Catenuloplanes japonicus]
MTTIGLPELLGFVTAVFTRRGVPPERASAAAAALLHGDLTGMSSHGLANLTRLYLPLLDSGRADPAADPRTLTDAGAIVHLDAARTLGLWSAGAAADLAVARAAAYGIGMVSVRGMTHIGCAGAHTLRIAERGMVGLIATNCGRQRIARPPGGRVAMLGTNPLSVAAPAGDHPPFVLDMSTTVVPTGRVRAAARAGDPVPAGWLATDCGTPVTDPGAFDRGEAHLQWLGGRPETGAYKGFGLALAVEVLSALVSGSGRGPDPEALDGDGGPSGRDDDIGMIVLAIAPGVLRAPEDVHADAGALFGSLLDCPPSGDLAVRYPGWHEAERAARCRAEGVPLSPQLYEELKQLAAAENLAMPGAVGVAG